MKTERVVVGISGASGAALGVRILERLAALPDIETHLVVSNAAWRTLALECAPDKLERLPSLVHHRHPVGDVGASIATGRTDTPLHLGHLRSMVAATEMGAIIMPPVPAFYHCPSSVAEIVDHLAARAIDLLALSQPPLPKAGRAERSALRKSFAAHSERRVAHQTKTITAT